MSGPDRMDWENYALARQYLVEEFIGSKMREAKRREDEEAKLTARNIRGR